jgi:OOP family OmpA-OmpF porin
MLQVVLIRGFWWNSFNGTVGITVYLGKMKSTWLGNSYRQDVLALTERVDNLETMLIDTDQDGVADYLDLEKTQFLV